MADKTLPPCPRADCDADPSWADHHDHLMGGAAHDRTPYPDCGHWETFMFTRCYSAHVNLSESPTGSPGGDEPEAVDLESLTAERDELRDWRDKVARALWCRGCGAQHPCRTRRAAEDVE